MIRRIALCAVIVAVGATSVAGAQSRTMQGDRETLIQLERDWDQAFRSKDVAFIANVLAEEFMATYGDGTRVDRAQELEMIANFNLQIDSSRVDDFTVNLYDDTAVVWFTQHLVGPSQGQALELTYRYMDVFVFRDGRWQCVASQSTQVAGAP
ncbi:MAG: nuclear transport factor 2 family protein [Acidobacteria bacterium]|nr:nuclear transport factor 2 family protein [Acidobacteriota bacterium]